jgi:hypothetical protein
MPDGLNENIQATLNFEGGEVTTGLLANITNRGFVIVCPELRDAKSAPGLRVMLELSGAGIETPQTAPGHIQGVRSEDASHHRVVVWVDDDADLNRMMESGITATFNRRGAFRVSPSHDEPVSVRLVLSDGSWSHEDHACDLSATGIALLVDNAIAERLDEANNLTVTVRLPRSPRPMTFMGHVRRLIPRGEQQLVGLDFDPGYTVDYDTLSGHITSYIMRRQREVLREDRGSHEAS